MQFFHFYKIFRGGGDAKGFHIFKGGVVTLYGLTKLYTNFILFEERVNFLKMFSVGQIKQNEKCR